MMASLKIEAIGHHDYTRMRLWCGVLYESGLKNCAKMLGQPSDFKRWGVWEIDGTKQREIYGRTDYKKANRNGSRGVIIWYQLEGGKRYLVKSPTSWKNTDEYICHVEQDGTIVRE